MLNKPSRTRIEEREQARLVRWSHKATVRQLAPSLRFLHHSPNGGLRDGFTGGQMKALGVKPGFPDLILTAPGRGCLAIEMKSDAGRLSPEQAEWRDHLTTCGWIWALCRSAEDARLVILTHLGLVPDEVPDL